MKGHSLSKIIAAVVFLFTTTIMLKREEIEQGYNRLTMFTPIYADKKLLNKAKRNFDFKGGGAYIAGTGIDANIDWTRSDLAEFKKMIYDAKVDIHNPPRATTDLAITGYVDFITHDDGIHVVEKGGHDCYRAIISSKPPAELELTKEQWVLGYFKKDLIESTKGWGEAEQEVTVYGSPVPSTFKYKGVGPEWALQVYAAAYAPRISWRDKFRHITI